MLQYSSQTLNNLLINIQILLNKITSIKETLDENIIEKTQINSNTLSYCFKNEEINHKISHYENEIPLLKTKIEEMKININEIKRMNNEILLQIFKEETENKLIYQDLIKFNIKNKEIEDENKKIMKNINKISAMNRKIQIQIDNKIHENMNKMNEIENLLEFSNEINN